MPVTTTCRPVVSVRRPTCVSTTRRCHSATSTLLCQLPASTVTHTSVLPADHQRRRPSSTRRPVAGEAAISCCCTLADDVGLSWRPDWALDQWRSLGGGGGKDWHVPTLLWPWWVLRFAEIQRVSGGVEVGWGVSRLRNETLLFNQCSVVYSAS